MENIDKFRAFCLIWMLAIRGNAGLQWPAGLYGLPQAQTGCLSSAGFQWKTGYRYHDLSDIRPHASDKSSSFHLAANINSNNVRRDFCMKTTTSSDKGRPNWPKGIYCVYRRGGSCPTGFSSGWIKWDDADNNNKNSRGGETPDGIYNSNTVIYFCCRGDGDTKEPISLPSDRDFFLLAYESTECQKVKWFIETTEWINYDTEGWPWHDNDQGGSYPYIANTNDRKLHYCYYKRCNYTITALSGTLNSPKYPSSYPSGQYCSWTIKAPQGYIMNISFPVFSLQSGGACTADYVAVYDGDKNISSSLRGKYCGTTRPSILVSTSNMMLIVFKSDKAKNYKGFELTFTTIAPPTTPPPTTPSPSTTLSSSTTILPSTSAVPPITSILPSTTIIPSSTPPSSTVTTRPTEPSTEAASTASPPETNEGRWPAGQYGIPQAMSGCPVSSNTTWESGYRFQDTDDGRTNQRSDDFHLAANVGDDVRRDFCVKTSTADDNVRFDWPTGTYCIYRKGDSCPVGFTSGWVFWDDENNIIGNNNQNGGVLPDGVYDSNTKIFYCCRDDGNKMTPILLPSRDDFLLLAYKSAECQKVDWMNEFSEFIQFATESSLDGDGSAKGGSHPFNATGKDHILYYCYYQGCKQVLTDQSGVIYSPRYPQNYSTNQHCSWTISPDNVTAIHLNLTFFSLENTADCTADSLLVYDGVNETAPLIGQFCGEHPPEKEIITTGPVVYLLFKSDDVNNFEGFSIKYTNWTLTPTPPPSTSPPTEITESPNTNEPRPTTEEGGHDKGSSGARTQDDNNVTAIVIPVVLILIIIIIIVALAFFWYKRRHNSPKENQSLMSYFRSLSMKDLKKRDDLESEDVEQDLAVENPLYDSNSLSSASERKLVLAMDNALYDSTNGVLNESAVVPPTENAEDVYTLPVPKALRKKTKDGKSGASSTTGQSGNDSVTMATEDVYTLPVPKALRKKSKQGNSLGSSDESRNNSVTMATEDFYTQPVPKALRNKTKSNQSIDDVSEDYAIAAPSARHGNDITANPIYE